MPRKHYMTLCFRDNTEVTHILKDTGLEITYEQAISGGFKTITMDAHSNVLANNGFSTSDIAFFKDFTLRNANLMLQEARGLL